MKWDDLEKDFPLPGRSPKGIKTSYQSKEGTLVYLQETEHKLYLHVYDSQGRHVGMNYELGEIGRAHV